MNNRPVQDFYPEDYAHCYGCGRLNDHGYQIKSLWDGKDAICHFSPQPYHISVPGYTYGGLLASLIDCHAMATAAAARYQKEEREPGSEPKLRYVTASLKIDYRKPTPLGMLELRAHVEEQSERKSRVLVDVFADEQLTVHAEVVAVVIPESMRGDTE